MVRISAAELGFIAVALVAAAMLSFLLTPVAIRIAVRAGAIDLPDEGRRVHRLPIPRGGGLAVATAFVVVGLAAWWVADANGVFARWPSAVMRGQRLEPTQMAALMGGVGLAVVFGFVDDRLQVRARWQLLEQIVLAGTAIAGGIVITFMYNPFQFLEGPLGVEKFQLAPEPVVWLVTALWIIGMINSINFIDGLDGLSTGVSLIAALTLGVISVTGALLSNVEPMVGLLCGVLAGALAGFLPWNFNPAKVFIGTTGVYAVGFALAVLSILGTAKIAVALLVLGVPIIDTFWIIVRRVSHGKSPFTPDRGHFHHRLLDLGLTHRNAVLLIYALCGVLAAISIVVSDLQAIYAFLGIVIAGGLVLYLFSRRAQEALDARSYPDDSAEDREHPGGGKGPDPDRLDLDAPRPGRPR